MVCSLTVWQRSHWTPFLAISLALITPVAGSSVKPSATTPMAVWQPAQSRSTAPLVSFEPSFQRARKIGSTTAWACIEPCHWA